jgi:hypothetical protein
MNFMCSERLTKKCIAQGNLLNPLHVRIIHEIRVNIEENRHIDCLPSIQSLLLKTETLDFAEIRRYLTRGDTVGRHANDILLAFICSCVESESRFTRKYFDLALLGHKFPRQDIRDGPVKGNAYAL